MVSRTAFNHKHDEGGTFLPIRYQTGNQIILWALWLHASARKKYEENERDLRKLKGREFYEALIAMGAYPRDAVLVNNMLVPLPEEERPKVAHDGIPLHDIIPSEQRFDKESKVRFMVKFRDMYGALDDPKSYVAAEQEIFLPEKTPHHFVHRKKGLRQYPPLRPGEDKHRPAEYWFNRDGSLSVCEYFNRDRSVDVDGQPAWEKLGDTTHMPQHVVFRHGKNEGMEEFFNEITGECTYAYILHDGRSIPITGDQAKEIRPPRQQPPADEPSVL